MDPRGMIIERPDRQSRGRRFGFGFLTLVFWMIWLYLWMPLITALAWYLGFRQFELQFLQLGGFDGLREVLGTYFTVFELIVVAFLGWSLYNQRRHARNKQVFPPVRTRYGRMCRTFGLHKSGLLRLRHSKRAVVDYDIGRSVLVLETTPMKNPRQRPSRERPDDSAQKP